MTNRTSENNKYYQYLQTKVKCGKDVFIAPDAIILGDVTLGDQVSIWYKAVLRGDFDSIEIGARTNIQDGVIMHVDPGKPLKVGKEIIIGHGAMLHGCTIKDNSLIGIKSTILNGAVVGKGCVIGAHALVTENVVIPDFSMVLGCPGKVVKKLPEAVIEKLNSGVKAYINEAKKYLKT